MAEAEIDSLSLAIGDELTGLSNRRGFEMLGERLLAAARRLGLPLTVVYADLDDMKAINDRFGHEAGDRALQEAARIIAEALRGSDLIARVGGDEFCTMLVGAESDGAATAVARIEAALTERNATSGEPFELSLSVGSAESRPGEETTLAELPRLPPTRRCTRRSASRRPPPDRLGWIEDGGPPQPWHPSLPAALSATGSGPRRGRGGGPPRPGRGRAFRRYGRRGGRLPWWSGSAARRSPRCCVPRPSG